MVIMIIGLYNQLIRKFCYGQKNLLTVGGLIGGIIVLSVIGFFIFDAITNSTSDDTSYSTEEMYFDNSTYDLNSILVPLIIQLLKQQPNP